MSISTSPNITKSLKFVDRLKKLLSSFTSSVCLLYLMARLTWQCSPILMFAMLGLVLVQAVLPTLNLFFYRLVLDRALLDLGYHMVADALAMRFPLLIWIICAAVIVVLVQLIQLIAIILQNIASDRLTMYMTEQILLATQRWQGLMRFEDPTFADDLNRTRSHASRAGLYMMVDGVQIVTHLFTIISLLILLTALHPFLPVVLLLASMPSMLNWWKYVASVSKIIYQQTPESRRLEYYRNTVLTLEPAKDVRFYGLASFFHERYERLFSTTMRELTSMRSRLTTRMILFNALSALTIGLSFIYATWLIMHGNLTVGDLILYGGALTLLQSHLRAFGIMGGHLPEILHFLPGVFRVVKTGNDLPIASVPLPAPRPILEGFVFEHVSFSYPDQTRPILQDVSFQIKPGECVALVGLNGAGKTTIVKLLLRLYDPTSGRILLDGVDLREYDLTDLRRELGAIFQDFVRYDLTVAENIGLGRVEDLEDTSRLLNAARKANADSLIAELPAGLATMLGRTFEGRDLSGGQWQKLALARAFVRDSQLLVLDEPTAALDVQTEYDVYKRFHELTRERMTLLISHRLSTVRMASHILYLEEGTIQEEGPHEVLMALDGAYARLYHMQAAYYRDEKPLEVQK